MTRKRNLPRFAPQPIIDNVALRPARPDPWGKFGCSFCAKPQSAVQHLIGGLGNVMICNECIELCVDLIEAEEIERP